MFADNHDSSDSAALLAAMDSAKQVLAEAKSVAPMLEEAHQMCLHVIERLEAITAKVETSQPQTSLQAISRLTAIAKAVLDFLKKFSNKKAAFRLVYNRKIVSQTLAFHDDIDNLLRGLDFPEDDWRPRWEGYRDAQQVAFEAMSRVRMKLIGDLRDAQAQTEALGLLLFEFHQVTSKYTQKELKVLNNAFGIVSQFSKNRAPTIGTWFLPPYEFECDETPFAWGAFGTVHHGKHCGSDVVIKRAKISSEADRAAFVREANTWFNANRIPNVVRLFGAYQIGPNPYFVCEYAANGTLSDYLFKEEHRHLTWKLLLQAAHGLKALHHSNIVHNDLKCNNILVATDGIAKLTDFGLSSQLSTQQSQSVSKPVGAYSWKAPELLAGTSASTYESDVYSFAMCIYEAVSHTTPWAGIEDVVIRRNVKRGILPKRPEGFTDEQWAMVEAMCGLNPEDRLPMDSVVEQLQKFAAAEYNMAHATAASNDSEPCSEPSTNAQSPLGSISEHPVALVSPELLPQPSPRPVSPERSPLTRVPVSATSVGGAPTSDGYGSTLPLSQDFVTAASILRHRKIREAGKNAIQYEIRLTLESGRELTVFKRYSAFRNLHAYFTCHFQPHTKEFPQFPRRRSFWSSRSASTIKQREEALGEFLQAVVANKVLPLEVYVDASQTVFTSDKRGSVAL